MEVLSLVLSALSLLGTIILTIWGVKVTIKLNQINLNSNICEKIFDEYLIKSIPQARSFLDFDKNNKFIGANKLQDVLRNIRKDCLYFRYYDKKFYKKLDEAIQDLEDLLVSNMKNKIDKIKQNDILNSIEEKISNIYNIIAQKKIKG